MKDHEKTKKDDYVNDKNDDNDDENVKSLDHENTKKQ